MRPRPGKMAGSLAAGMLLVVIGLAIWRPDRPAFRPWPVGPWTVKAADGSRLRVLATSDTAATVELTDLGPNAPPGRLQRRIAIEPARAGVVQFRARAQSPQKVAVSLLETRLPYADLGWHHALELTPEWRRFQLVLPRQVTEREAWFCFDVARAGNPVSLDEFAIASQAWRTVPAMTSLAETPRGTERDLDLELRDLGADRTEPLVLRHGPWTWEAGAVYRVDLTLSAARPGRIDLVPGAGLAGEPPPADAVGWPVELGAGEVRVAEFWRAGADALDGYLALVVRHAAGRLVATGLDVRRLPWHLVTRRQAQAQLAPLSPTPGGWLVTVAPQGEAALGDVQLVQGGLPIAAGAEYELTLRARTNAPRTGRALVTAGLPPYEALGLVSEWPLATEWETTTSVFRATASADDANLALELGGPAGQIEIAAIELRRLDASREAAANVADRLRDSATVDGSQTRAEPSPANPAGGDSPKSDADTVEPAGRDGQPPAEPWRLLTHGEARAESRTPDGEPNGVRIEITEIGQGPAWQVQWTQSGLALRAGRRYELRGRVRSDAPRTVACAVAQDHEPWQGLGLYQEWQATPEWQAFRWPFTATADEDQARVYFDLGQAAAAIELRDLELVEVD